MDIDFSEFKLPYHKNLGILKIKSVYYHYDNVPRLFTCVSDNGLLFLGLSIEDTTEVCKWLFAPITKQILDDLLSKKISIKDCVLTRIKQDVFFIVESYSGEVIDFYLLDSSIVSNEDLPTKNVYLE